MTRRSSCLWLSLASGLLLAVSCGWDDEEDNAPSTRPRGMAREPVAVPAPEAEAEAPKPEPKKPAPFDWDKFNEEPKAEAAPQDEEKKPERDYAADLRSAVGSPVACLEKRDGPDVPPKIDIMLTAVVIDSGRITRGTASSAQLRPGEIECMTKRLKASRIPGNVEDSPRTISTTVSLELKKPTKKAAGATGGAAAATDKSAQ